MRQQENIQTGGNVINDYYELSDDITLVIGDDEEWYIIDEPFDIVYNYVDVNRVIDQGSI